MTNNEYKQLKPEGMSFFGKVVISVVIPVVSIFGSYKIAQHFIDKHQNRAEVEVSNDKAFPLRLDYTKYKEGKPVTHFEWIRYEKCCEKLTIERVDDLSYPNCMMGGKEDKYPFDKGIRLELRNLNFYDFDCDEKCDKVRSNTSNTSIYRGQEGLDKSFETADQNLGLAKELINMEIDLEKTVGDWLEE